MDNLWIIDGLSMDMVGVFNPSEKYEFVHWDGYSQWKSKTYSKPPTKSDSSNGRPPHNQHNSGLNHHALTVKTCEN